MKLIIISCFIFCALQFSYAQYALFGRSGTISYDKTMYIKNIVKKKFIEKGGEFSRAQFEAMLPAIPENVVLKKILSFTESETLFEPLKGQELDTRTQQQVMMFALDFDSQTHSDLSSRAYKRFMNIGGEKLIIQDSMKRMTWRITDEYRDIAGYACRRANGLTPDSIYVVAYYANELPVSAGPESVNGLPGMILGLVVPSQHVSYFATKVELHNTVQFDTKNLEDKKVKVMSRQAMASLLLSTMNWLNKETKEYIIELALL